MLGMISGWRLFTLILNGLSLSRWCSLGDCLVEKSDHFAYATSLEEPEGGQLARLQKHYWVLHIWIVPQYSCAIQFSSVQLRGVA